MAPLLFLLITTLVVFSLGRINEHIAGHGLRSWPTAIRFGLAVMFTVTGVSHFVGMRDELVAMVPPWAPAPAALVTITGAFELLGAVGLLLRPTRLWASLGLSLMLVLMFPANVHLALTGENLPWTDELLPRTAMQLIFFAAVLVVLVPEIRSRQRRHRSPL